MASGTEPGDVEAAVRRAHGGQSPEEPAVEGPRRITLEERRFADLLRILLDHPLHGAACGDEIRAGAPDAVWDELAHVLLAACAGPEPVDVAALADRIEGEPRSRLMALAAEPLDGLDDAERALQALHDTLAWLRGRRERREAHDLNARLGQSRGDATALLREKQQQLERRRAAQGVASG